MQLGSRFGAFTYSGGQRRADAHEAIALFGSSEQHYYAKFMHFYNFEKSIKTNENSIYRQNEREKIVAFFIFREKCEMNSHKRGWGHK